MKNDSRRSPHAIRSTEEIRIALAEKGIIMTRQGVWKSLRSAEKNLRDALAEYK